MDEKRAKALVRAARMLRLARDPRTPENERLAAVGRLDAAAERWEFTVAEVNEELERQLEGDLPTFIRQRREHERAMAAARARGGAPGFAGGIVVEGLEFGAGAGIRFGNGNSVYNVRIVWQG